MSSERMRFKENLKKACERKEMSHSASYHHGTTKAESPVPYFTEEERTYWENNNNILESSDSEDYTVQENENQALNDNISTEDPITNTYNEQQIHTKLATNRDQNLILNDSTIIVNNDPLLSSNTDPDSCIVALNNLDSFLQSPVMSSNNAPTSSIASLLDINGINSIPPSPLDNGTPGTSLLSIQSPPSITSTPRSRINNNVNKKDKGPPTSSIASLLDIDGINSIPPSPLDNGTPGTSLLSIQSPPSVASTTRSRINNNENKKDKGRGRRVHKDQWKDVKRKLNRNTGKCYFSRDGTERPGRIIKAFCNKCKFHCPQKFTDELRKKIFDSFWSIGNNVRQWDFISKYCKKINKRRRTTELPSRRQYTITYSLPIVGSPVDPVPVCKVMFLNTLGIGAGMVTTALKKIEDSGGIITADARGGRNNRQLVIDAEMIKSVCDHVNNFQPVESHYVRSRTSKLYLDESLSYSRMFLLYKEWVVDNSLYYSNPAKTLRQYRDIVNTNFNLGFHAPRKDQCDVCHVYKNLPKPVPETEFKTYTDHIRNKEIARELKNKYKELSVRDSDKTLTTTYDFQKIHGIPHGQASILYYKRKLSVYNLTFYSLGKKEGTCYVWDETTAKKGATEVSSCVYNYIKEHNQKGIINFNFFSDNCGGQNRNRIVFLAYLYAAKHFNVTITHTFLERGHTQNEGDSVHALIERFAKNKMIYSPDDWYNMIRWAKQDDKPYHVIEMQNPDFLDFKQFLSGANWVINAKGEKMMWSQIRQLQVLPNETDRIYYKTDFCSHEYDCIILYTHRQLNTRRRRKEIVADGEQCSISKAYFHKFSVPKNKFQDLKYLCDHQIIPVKYHNFYQSLVPGGDDEAELNED